VTEAKSNEWYMETARKVYLPDVWLKAANALVEEGHLSKDEVPSTDGFKPSTGDFIDGVEYDGKDPVGYLSKLKIGLKDIM
jgi:nitrate/nitrite transport system substrate-binding protein